MKKEMIRRDLKLVSQIRETNDGKRTIEGFIPYNSRSEYMGFYEYISETAFNKTLADGADVRCLMNHDDGKLLGRVKNGSLRLRSEADGLHIECDLPNTTYADDVYNLIKEEYNTGLSFGFYIIKEDYSTEEVDEEEFEVHTLREVRLLEVSFAVSFPAYEATNSKARSIRGINLDEVADLLEKKEELSEDECKKLKEVKNAIEEILPKEKEEPVLTDDTSAAESTEDEEEKKQLDSLIAELKKIKNGD